MIDIAEPVIIASERGEVGLAAGMELLRGGASAMDAVEAAIRLVESNEADHYVGVGGLPNVLGEVELDASIMDGATRRAAAVAAVRGFIHPISIARAVWDRLPQHLLLVGAGAELFADEAGMERGETLTDEARKMWQDGLGGGAARQEPGEPAAERGGTKRGGTKRGGTEQGGTEQGGTEQGGTEQGGTERADDERTALARFQELALPGGPWGTVNVLALDSAGHLCSGVSTSGYPWKYPGRVGDSALIGAGNYCDDRLGAAACTGSGELAIRGGTARLVLLALAAGHDPAGACADALERTLELPDDFPSPLQTLCLTPDGRHGGASTKEGATYTVLTARDDSFVTKERSKV